ncbi:hypothetical protein BOH78_2201 [Pichia kudriavzevii]|uniref:Uncharacterized protein n=1 Tax=Pichia kudriavzevii TaxID=4909 RepID=A0A1V2LP64_PICKU|nr:hypothetical protein BOH78_2201 [Pichia kudriavzevii]
MFHFLHLLYSSLKFQIHLSEVIFCLLKVKSSNYIILIDYNNNVWATIKGIITYIAVDLLNLVKPINQLVGVHSDREELKKLQGRVATVSQTLRAANVKVEPAGRGAVGINRMSLRRKTLLWRS